MQNQPPEQREAFEPSPGCKFVNADMGAQELGIMAYGSREDSWIDTMTKGLDLHSVRSAMFFPEWEELTEEGCVFPLKCSCKGHKVLRQKGKRFNFGIPYGKGGQTIALDLDISERKAWALIKKDKRLAPKLHRWLRVNGEQAIRDKVAYTLPPFNRFRNLEDIKDDWHRRNQGFNTPVQGTGADMIKLSMWYAYKVILEKPYLGAKLLLTVHDELVTECLAEYAEEWRLLLKDAMRRAAELITMPGLITIEPIIQMKWEKEQ